MWWALEVDNWTVSCNIVAFYFGWAFFLTLNLLPRFIESPSIPWSGLIVPFAIEGAKVGVLVWIVYSAFGDQGLLSFIGFMIAGLIGLASMANKCRTREA